MAIATPIKEYVGVRLTLDVDEADVLLDILRNIGGFSRRELADNVMDALEDAGVTGTEFNDVIGGIVFKEMENY